MAAQHIRQRLASTAAGNRVYPLLMPQNPTYPAVTFQTISTRRVHAFGGDAGVIEKRVQIDAWAKTYAEAKALANQITAALNRVKDGSVIDAFLDNDREMYETDSGIRRISHDFIFFIRQDN